MTWTATLCRVLRIKEFEFDNGIGCNCSIKIVAQGLEAAIQNDLKGEGSEKEQFSQFLQNKNISWVSRASKALLFLSSSGAYNNLKNMSNKLLRLLPSI